MNPKNIPLFAKESHLSDLSEEDFRDTIVRPLLLNMGYYDGRDLCGPDENGKDAIFFEKTLIGSDNMIAVQTKKGNITLSLKATDNLITCKTQIMTALETNITILNPSRKVKPNKVLLCASGKINDKARDHILNEITNPNIIFFDRDDIIQRVDDLLPEIWLGINTGITPLFRAIENLALGQSASQTKEIDAFSAGATDESYVDVNIYRTIRKQQKVSGSLVLNDEIDQISLLEATKISNNRVLIIGDAGSGKSTGLLRLALILTRKSYDNLSDYKIPILLKASFISSNSDKTILEMCEDWVKSMVPNTTSCFKHKDLTDGKIILLIDGLDEIPDEQLRSTLIEKIIVFSTTYNRCKIIATSRPLTYFTKNRDSMIFEEYHFNGISLNQAEKIISQINKNKVVSNVRQAECLRQLENIHGIELNPLLVSVFAIASSGEVSDIPANITELFKKFTELMLGRWDERKGFSMQYQFNVKDNILIKIAHQLHRQKKTRVPMQEFNAMALSELYKMGYKNSGNNLINEITDRSGLFKIEDDSIEFKHHLLQEFYAGRGIVYEDIKTFSCDEWWRKPILFYFGNSPQNASTISQIVTDVRDKKNNTDTLNAIITLGYSLQACYLSHVSTKIDVWKSLVLELIFQEKEFSVHALREYPLIKFAYYLNETRGSISLSNLSDNYSEIIEWATDTGSRERNDVMLWLMIGLLESGELNAASLVFEKMSTPDNKTALGIALGYLIAFNVKHIDKLEKKKFKKSYKTALEKSNTAFTSLFAEFSAATKEWRTQITNQQENPEQ